MMRWVGHIALMGETRNIYIIVVEKPERKRTLVKIVRSCEDNVKMDLKEGGVEVVDWFELAQDRDQ
jgi:hypothetical protein